MEVSGVCPPYQQIYIFILFWTYLTYISGAIMLNVSCLVITHTVIILRLDILSTIHLMPTLWISAAGVSHLSSMPFKQSCKETIGCVYWKRIWCHQKWAISKSCPGKLAQGSCGVDIDNIQQVAKYFALRSNWAAYHGEENITGFQLLQMKGLGKGKHRDSRMGVKIHGSVTPNEYSLYSCSHLMLSYLNTRSYLYWKKKPLGKLVLLTRL